MINFPDLFSASKEHIQKFNNLPAIPISFDFKKPNLSNFLSFYREKIVDTGMIFDFENFDYKINEEIVNNLKLQSYMYSKNQNKYVFRRYKSLIDIKNGPLSMRIYNFVNGWAEPIQKEYPGLIELIESFAQSQNLKIYFVNILFSAHHLPYHIDADGYHGYRLHLSNDCYKFTFRRLFKDKSMDYRILAFQGKQTEINDNLNRWAERGELILTNQELKSAFLIDSANYIHSFDTDSLTAIAAIYALSQ